MHSGIEPSIKFFLAASTAVYCIDNALYWVIAFLLFIWSFSPSWQEIAAQAPLAIALALLGREVYGRFSFQHLHFRNLFSPVKGVLLTVFVAFVGLYFYEERIATCPEELLYTNRRKGFPIGRMRAFIVVVVSLVLAYILEIKCIRWIQEENLKDVIMQANLASQLPNDYTNSTDGAVFERISDNNTSNSETLRTQQHQSRAIEIFRERSRAFYVFYVVPAVWLGLFIIGDVIFQQKTLWNLRLFAISAVFSLGVLIAEVYTSSYEYKPRQKDEQLLKRILKGIRMQREKFQNLLHL